MFEQKETMTREMIEARKTQLQQTLQKMKGAAMQHQANLHGVEGAIADCDFWLSQLPPCPEATQEPVAGGESTVPSNQAA